MRMLIKNGTVINADGRSNANVIVENGKIEAVKLRSEQNSGTKPIDAQSFGETIDASGLLVLPGAIDAHTHFELPYKQSWGSGTSADDFFTGTRSAACGGVTTVIDFVTPEKGESLTAALEKRKAQAAGKSCIDYAFHMSLTEVNDRTQEEMKAIFDAGINSFKVYMTYGFRVSDEEFLKALTYAAEIGALIMVHAEDHAELTARIAEFTEKGTLSPRHHYLSRDEEVESRAAEHAINLAKKAAEESYPRCVTLYIVHLACRDGVAAVRKAQQESLKTNANLKIIAETCPQYLHFTSDVYKRPDGQNFVCSPPVKDRASRDALWQGINDGTISVVATDHCPFMLSEKAQGKDDFTKIPNGVMGTGILYPYMLSCAAEGKLTYERAVELCCKNPAEIFSPGNKKGTLAPGADADIVLYDPRKEHVVTQANSHSAADYTIWEGTRLKGSITAVYSHGKLVFKYGCFLPGENLR